MASLQKQYAWEESMALKILSLLEDQLYMDFRYLDSSMAALKPVCRRELNAMATDGIYLFYSPDQLLRVFPSNPVFLNRSCLHLLFHCLFRHLFFRGKRDPQLWSLACDITVEWIIDSLDQASVRRPLSGIRTDLYAHFAGEEIPVTAASVYRYLAGLVDEELLFAWQKEFYVDDHRYWPADPSSSPSAARAGRKWEEIGRKASQEMDLRGADPGQTVHSLRTQITAGKSRRSYQDFLRKFTILKEELHIDEDTFDLSFYTYGLSLYGNMPLIEPLESREITKIRDFAIVIDTSYSTSGSLVRSFLTKTFALLKSRDSFFSESRIHIIQCDNMVQTDHLICRPSDLDALLKDFELKGGGGTDFRPAFTYIDQLIEEGQLSQLKGVLYFTDGKGLYPKHPPAYAAAFIFVGKDSERPPVPAWAMKLDLEEEDLL